MVNFVEIDRTFGGKVRIALPQAPNYDDIYRDLFINEDTSKPYGAYFQVNTRREMSVINK